MEDSSILPAEFQKDEGLRTLANFLRSENGVKLYKAVEHEKRVEYFKGKNFVEVLTRIGSDLDASKAGREKARKWPKSLPKINDVAVALAVGNALLNKGFFHRSDKQEAKKGSERILTVSPVSRQTFEEAGVFTWMYQGNMMWTHVMSGALIAVVIGFTLLPIWPDIAKKVLWYISVTVLIAIFLLCLIRFVAFLVMWILGYEFWVFPRLFDETLSFQDSFKPVWTFEAGPPGQGYYRIGLLVGLVAFVAWAMTKPTEFDGFLQAQKSFLDDLYSGNLLADVAQDHKDNLDRTKKGPTLEDLLREEEEERRIDDARREVEAVIRGDEEDEEAAAAARLDKMLEDEGLGGQE